MDFVTKSIQDFTSGLQGDVENISGIFGVIGLVAGTIGNSIAESWSFSNLLSWVCCCLNCLQCSFGSWLAGYGC